MSVHAFTKPFDMGTVEKLANQQSLGRAALIAAISGAAAPVAMHPAAGEDPAN